MKMKRSVTSKKNEDVFELIRRPTHAREHRREKGACKAKVQGEERL
jgi:hypothetical protein